MKIETRMRVERAVARLSRADVVEAICDYVMKHKIGFDDGWFIPVGGVELLEDDTASVQLECQHRKG